MGESPTGGADSLRIAGVSPFSTVDWPDKLSAALFLQGCPWRCPYCHNKSILDMRAPGQVPWGEVVSLLERRRGLLDAVVFSGGEALAQGADEQSPLFHAMRQARDMGFQVGLHTAGVFPDRLDKVAQSRLIDWVGLDVKAMPSEYAKASASPVAAKRTLDSLGVLADHSARTGLDWEARLTLWPGLIVDDPRALGAGDSASPIVVSPEALLDYAVDVATWARNAGARKFALQRYRRPEPQGATQAGDLTHYAANWDEHQARERLEHLGFSEVFIR